jgi:hypothetical protein
LFYQDRQNTYLRNPEAPKLGNHGRFSYLVEKEHPDDIYPNQLRPTHSYVPSGTVSALLLLMEYFRKQPGGREITPVPFLPDDTVPDKANLIVLGTSTSMDAVATLERSLPFYTGLTQEITIEGEEPVKDTEYDEHGVRMFHKWGTLTRRWFKYNDRIVTVISGHHGRVVEALAEFLTTRSAFATLAELFHNPVTLPAYFQALFSVHLEEKPRGPLPIGTEAMRVIEINKKRLAATR